MEDEDSVLVVLLSISSIVLSALGGGKFVFTLRLRIRGFSFAGGKYQVGRIPTFPFASPLAYAPGTRSWLSLQCSAVDHPLCLIQRWLLQASVTELYP